MSRLLLLVAALVASTPVRALTLDFESLAHGGSEAIYVSVASEDGYRVSSTIDPIFSDQAFGVWGTAAPSFNGSTALFNAFEGALTVLRREDDAPFALQSIEVGPAFVDAGSGGPVEFMGRRPDGGMVTQAFFFDSALAPRRLSFGSAFADVVSVSWEQAGQFHQFDNVVVAQAIPEPGTAALLLAGLGVLGFSAAGRAARRPGPRGQP